MQPTCYGRFDTRRGTAGWGALRLALVAAASALAAVAVSGCGVGAPSESAVVAPASAATPAAAPVSTTPRVRALEGMIPPGPTDNVVAPTRPSAPITPTASTPRDVVRAANRGVVVVLFTLADGVDDAAMRTAVKTAVSAAPGREAVFRYSVGDVGRYGDLPTLLGIDSPPTVVVLAKGGVLQNRFVGFVDAGTLGAALADAHRAPEALALP